MNVLINAYAVSPNWGSEPGMGWNWIINIARYCNVFVITEGEWRDEIEEALKCLSQKDNIHFYYNPVSERVRKMCWNQGDWRFYIHYRKWQKGALRLARKIIGENKIDIIHQLNMVGFREPGYLWKIKGIPFVWGPIGGCELMPMNMLKTESFSIKAASFTKNVLNYIQSHFSVRVRRAVRSSSCVITAVQAAYNLIQSYYRHENVVFINETGLYSKSTSSNLKRHAGTSTFELIWIGKFDYRKKLDIALMTMSHLKGENVHLTIVGTGDNSQVSRYRKLAESLGLTDAITWLGLVPNSDIPALMQSSDLFFFTSIMEATSTVVPEAISNNLPVLCFNTCGFGHIVSGKTGETIELSTPEDAAIEFAEKIRHFASHRHELEEYSKACARYKEELSWGWKARRMLEIYEQVINT